MRLSRWYLWLIAVSVLGLITLLVNAHLGVVRMGNLDAWIAIHFLAVCYSVVGLACAAAYENGRAPALMRSGMIVGLIALAGWSFIGLTSELQATSGPTRICTWLSIWPCLMALGGLLMLLPMNDGWRLRLRAITLVLLAVMGLYIGCAVWFYPEPADSSAGDYQRRWQYEETAYRIGGGLAALAGGSLAVTLVVGLMGVLTGRSASARPGTRQPYWLQCPRCGLEQQAQTGEYACASCRLRARIELT